MVYYSPYKQIWRALIRALRTFISSLFSKRLLLMIIVALVIMLLHLNVQAITYSTTNDPVSSGTLMISAEDEIIHDQEKLQNDLVLFMYYPFISKSDSWYNEIKPFFDNVRDYQYDIYVSSINKSANSNTPRVSYSVYTYYRNNNTSIHQRLSFQSTQTNQVFVVDGTMFRNVSGNNYNPKSTTFILTPQTNSVKTNSFSPTNIVIPNILVGYKTSMWQHFTELVESGINDNDYSTILNDINSYLSNIDSNTDNLESILQNILNILNTISQQSPIDYTEQITGINNQVNRLNSSIQAQTQQQHQDAQETQNAINNQTTKIEEQTNSINNMSDFLQDDTFSSDSVTDNMPSSDEFQDVTENGFDNIFTLLRDTFTSDNYKDIVIGVPFSNGQSITIPSNLTENFIPEVIKNLIQMVYWYFIARFIVKDIAGYIEKAKSGDVFSSSDTNIKTDML